MAAALKPSRSWAGTRPAEACCSTVMRIQTLRAPETPATFTSKPFGVQVAIGSTESTGCRMCEVMSVRTIPKFAETKRPPVETFKSSGILVTAVGAAAMLPRPSMP